ncbi:MAG: ABC transporter ATP-binding protein [Bradyrhizobium sp.]|jgi:branched-chain amino acid transport system ATP-binding protein|uniref:ABC transporter ATP-binding protein n=1 Tax=Bradyrhizobium denitrificans TaxID=2734912 RepID=A0ABS5G4T9_9BRAD|nr:MULTISPECIES: ABC transporter ATP-binding protein [Bradyrhizobium]MBR1136327.1 ABC transporter ATP-binding protein [Bradyrhizobium denitrificans]MDU0956942.1 ABC transporter ATP-binding protein [Bradyrhizobium sp.]MDU1492770.1 ABC transporter ATP-binding protein [Bradyrhizobium sp.]MDU1543106.1 ABC transporter ATP-binding protein [Bradyrhizobium sp.]MDU1666705.1 ABC transporter ATP-binding protein [Bradyrhizobium sp.]
MTAILEVNALASGYGSSEVISNVGLTLAKAETLAIVGKNGMGKTSLLKAIMGFLPAWRGSVTLAGKDVTRVAPHLKRKMGLVYVPQEHALFQDLSVRDNLRLGLLSDKDIEALFEQVGSWFPVLTKRLNQRAGTLSGGEQKMLIVARALMAKPDVLLLDEVTEGLQPSVVDRLSEVLVRVRREIGTSMIVVEQHLPFALSISDRYLVFKRGEIVDAAVVDAGAAARIDAHMRI